MHMINDLLNEFKAWNETSCSLHVLQVNKKIFILNRKQTVFNCADKLKS